MASPTYRKHELQFCSEVSKWADALFKENLALPFGSSDIESFGRGSQKRQDFRVYGRSERGRAGAARQLAAYGARAKDAVPLLTKLAESKSYQEKHSAEAALAAIQAAL